MHRAPRDSYNCACGIEVLIRDLPYPSAVNSISEVRSKSCHIKMLRSFTDLFIGSKCYTYLTVFFFGMAQEITCHAHDLSHTRLVVSAKKCCPIRCDQRLTGIQLQIRKKFR